MPTAETAQLVVKHRYRLIRTALVIFVGCFASHLIPGLYALIGFGIVGLYLAFIIKRELNDYATIGKEYQIEVPTKLF